MNRKKKEKLHKQNLGTMEKLLIGAKIIGLTIGPDCDGDDQIYYICFDNGIKLGMAHVLPNGKVYPLNRKEKLKDGSIIRFQLIIPEVEGLIT